MTTKTQAFSYRKDLLKLETRLTQRDLTISGLRAEIDRLNEIIHTLTFVPEKTKGIEAVIRDGLKMVYPYFDDLILTTKCRKRKYVEPRQIFMSFMCEYSSMSLEAIGHLCGHRDHSTVLHGRDTIRDLVISSKDVREKYYQMKSYIKNNGK